MTPNQPAFLLVDGDSNDRDLTFEAFRRAGFENPIFAVDNKPDALRYLRGEGEYADRSRFPLPRLVLVDHKTPGEDWMILKWVRNEPNFAHLPVAILTGSINPADQKKAEEMGASAYHLKPQTFEELVSLIRRIAEFWVRDGSPHPSAISANTATNAASL